jgi:hypothetical protein
VKFADILKIYFMEVNLRLTGSNSLSFQQNETRDRNSPIFSMISANILGVRVNLDRSVINEEWIGLIRKKRFCFFRNKDMTILDIEFTMITAKSTEKVNSLVNSWIDDHCSIL